MTAVRKNLLTPELLIDDIEYIVIDLFCGAGGTTIGFEEANKSLNRLISKVIACVNHDHLAIKSHWSNHPEVEHFEEDIRLLDPFGRLKRLVDIYRAFYPNAKVILWASLECTNFSKAKGGQPRDADSRTLADHLHKYILALDPDFIKIENVVEFMSWGPLDEKGKPISKKSGTDWLRWRNEICAHGYFDDWRELNSADFGALTSRNRLFGCFAKHGLSITWPTPTHSKKPEKDIFGNLKKWEPVKKALDFNDEGNSVFNRKKPLSTKTMQRLFMGCVKHIAGGKKSFISRYYGGNPEHRNHSVDEPTGVIPTNNRLSLINAFIVKGFSANSGKSVNAGSSIENPAPTLTTQNRERLAFISRYNGVNGGKHDNSHSVDGPVGALGTGDNHAKVSAHFIQKYYSQGGQHNSIDEPAATLTTKGRLSKVSATFIDQRNGTNPESRSSSIEQPSKTLTSTRGNQQLVHASFIDKYYELGDNIYQSEKEKSHFIEKKYNGPHNHQSIEQPAGSIVSNDKHNLITADKWLMNTNFNNVGSSLEEPSPVITAGRHHHYLINPSWGGNPGSIEAPCPVVIARQDKAPLYLITCSEGPIAVPVYENDCEWTIKLKEFMALYGISDIKMRMLKVPELIQIQGFPKTYILLGNQTDQKKFIGNAVHPLVPMHWITAMSDKQKRMAA